MLLRARLWPLLSYLGEMERAKSYACTANMPADYFGTPRKWHEDVAIRLLEGDTAIGPANTRANTGSSVEFASSREWYRRVLTSWLGQEHAREFFEGNDTVASAAIEAGVTAQEPDTSESVAAQVEIYSARIASWDAAELFGR